MTPTRQVAIFALMYQNYDQRVVRGIAAYVQAHANWSLYVEEELVHKMPDLRSWQGDGLIVNFDDPAAARLAMNIGKPVVGYGGGLGAYEQGCGIPYFETDDENIARLAAEHLLDRGLENFAYCGYPATRLNVWDDKREAGFKQRLAQEGYSCRVFKGRYRTARHWEPLIAELVTWLRTLPTPLGLMACYDARARHVLEACRTLGLHVPDDVALIGVDDDPIMCELANPPLSSVEQGCFRLGYEAAALLDRLLAGQKPDQMRYRIPPAGLTARQSTDMLAVSDPMVADALRLIRQRACDGLSPEAIVREQFVSRSTLDNRFKEVLGRTVHKEIQRVQLEHAKRLLSHTDLPLRIVARKSGYANEQYLVAVIRKHTKMTPTQYRQSRWSAKLPVNSLLGQKLGFLSRATP